MGNFVAGNYSFQALVNEKLEPLQIWIQKIQLSNKPYYLNPKLYKKIVQNVEDAFFFDHNMIIEEFNFYQELPPQMQGEVIKLVFADFLKQFDHFLGSFEEGFRNAFVVNLYTRNYKEYDFFAHAGHEVTQIIMVTEGAAHMVSKEEFYFMVLPTYGVFGDFNVAFEAKSMISLRGPPVPDHVIVPPNTEIFTCKTMNCDSDVFQELMELYPDTAENVKIRALEKREVLMYYLQKERYRQLSRLGVQMSKKEKQKFNNWINLTTMEESDFDSDEFEHHISKPYLHETAKYKNPETLEKEAEFMSDEKDEDSAEEDNIVHQTVDSISSTVKAMHSVMRMFKDKNAKTGALADEFMTMVKGKSTNEYVFEDKQEEAGEEEL